MTRPTPRDHERRLAALQHALEEGLRAIAAARTPTEAEAARARARARLESLGFRAARVADDRDDP